MVLRLALNLKPLNLSRLGFDLSVMAAVRFGLTVKDSL
jgi:hypothetical protein